MFWVELDPQVPKLGQVRSGWLSDGSKFGFNSNFYLMNPIYRSVRGGLGPQSPKLDQVVLV